MIYSLQAECGVANLAIRFLKYILIIRQIRKIRVRF
jgi:hypothetical protein